MDANTTSFLTGATANPVAKARTQTLRAIRSTRNKPGNRSLGSRLRRWSAMRSKGFTLVEILIVILIIVVIVSLTVLTVSSNGRDSQLDEESRRIEGLVGLRHDRALLEGRDFGLRMEPAAYEFLVYDTFRDRWLMLDQ